MSSLPKGAQETPESTQKLNLQLEALTFKNTSTPLPRNENPKAAGTWVPQNIVS